MLKIAVTVVLIVCTLAVSAQRVEIGVEVGANTLPIRLSDLGADFQFGGFGGLGVKYKISNRFSLRSGVFISQQKKAYRLMETRSLLDEYALLFQLAGIEMSDIETALEDANVNADIIENTVGVVSEVYLQIPVLTDYKIQVFNFVIGPYFGALLSAKRNEQIAITVPLLQAVDLASFDSSGLLGSVLPAAEETEVSTETGLSGLRKFDVGATIGIGYSVNRYSLGLSFSQGFLDYRMSENHDTFQAHQSIRLSLSYFLPVGNTSKGESKKKVKKSKTNPTL